MQRIKNARVTFSDWPVDGLESVINCPVCGANERELLHKGQTDKVFFCAPGKWNIYRCKPCASAYLDPRPNSETIGLAYQRYYTHDKESDYKSLRFLEKIRRQFANGYRNSRFGTKDQPASLFGNLVASLMPKGRAIIDAGMRHLPKSKVGDRLLDVGCGNGAFLMRAHSAGWDVVGVDFDPKAVEAACRFGLDVRLGGVEILDSSIEQFDVITLAHVIEHVHHPIQVLQACFSLLKPGGFLWIETPNVASAGHRLYGEAWRGLEPPRHLVLFTLESMCNALSASGFTEVQVQPYRPICAGIFGASKAIAEGVNPYFESRRSESSAIVNNAERVASRNPNCREFITVKAWRM